MYICEICYTPCQCSKKEYTVAARYKKKARYFRIRDIIEVIQDIKKEGYNFQINDLYLSSSINL